MNIYALIPTQTGRIPDQKLVREFSASFRQVFVGNLSSLHQNYFRAPSEINNLSIFLNLIAAGPASSRQKTWVPDHSCNALCTSPTQKDVAFCRTTKDHRLLRIASRGIDCNHKKEGEYQCQDRGKESLKVVEGTHQTPLLSSDTTV
jgi:hypothetical protein